MAETSERFCPHCLTRLDKEFEGKCTGCKLKPPTPLTVEEANELAMMRLAEAALTIKNVRGYLIGTRQPEGAVRGLMRKIIECYRIVRFHEDE